MDYVVYTNFKTRMEDFLRYVSFLLLSFLVNGKSNIILRPLIYLKK